MSGNISGISTPILLILNRILSTIIKRILEMGDARAYEWLKIVFGLKKIMHVSKKARLSVKSKNYWRLELAK